MNGTAQDPRDSDPEGLHNSDGGTRAEAILPAGSLYDAAIARLSHLPDGRLAEFSTSLDAALAKTGSGTDDISDLVAVAAAARLTLRRRQEAAARQEATTIVHQLISTTETE